MKWEGWRQLVYWNADTFHVGISLDIGCIFEGVVRGRNHYAGQCVVCMCVYMRFNLKFGKQ